MILPKLDVTNSIKKLALRNRISGFILAEDVLDPTTGEVLAEAGTNVDMELADKIQNAAVASVMIQTEEGATKILLTWK